MIGRSRPKKARDLLRPRLGASQAARSSPEVEDCLAGERVLCEVVDGHLLL